MRAALLPLTGLLFVAKVVAGQGAAYDGSKPINYYDLALSGARDQFSVALAWSHLHGIGRRNKIQIGYGVRFTSFAASGKYYTTAPSKYTSTAQNLSTIFSNTISKNIDTITTSGALTNSLNAAIYLQYNIGCRFDLGFNIDAIGVSFGPTKKFNVVSSVLDPNQSTEQYASPTKFNLLLTSDNDIGSLNSEFYLRYWINGVVGLRAGYTFLFSEYRTENNLSFDHGRIMNDRYRYKAGMALLAVTFRPFGRRSQFP